MRDLIAHSSAASNKVEDIDQKLLDNFNEVTYLCEIINKAKIDVITTSSPFSIDLPPTSTSEKRDTELQTMFDCTIRNLTFVNNNRVCIRHNTPPAQSSPAC